MFLEELKSINIMNTGLSKKKRKGQPEDGGLKGGEIENTRNMKDLCWGTFASLFQCLFHMSRGIKRVKDERGKRMKGKERKGKVEACKGRMHRKEQPSILHTQTQRLKTGTGLYHNENTLRWKEMTETVNSQVHSGKAETSNVKRHKE